MIFIGGVHGVGKSFFCSKISEKYNIPYYTASTLISELKSEWFANDKRIANIDSNQNHLIDAVNRLQVVNTNFILDGHFCLLNTKGMVQRVSLITFGLLKPQAIIVLYDNVQTIIERLNNRDTIQHDINLIEDFQREELKYSREVSQMLQIPYLTYGNLADTESAYELIEKVLINNPDQNQLSIDII